MHRYIYSLLHAQILGWMTSRLIRVSVWVRQTNPFAVCVYRAKSEHVTRLGISLWVLHWAKGQIVRGVGVVGAG